MKREKVTRKTKVAGSILPRKLVEVRDSDKDVTVTSEPEPDMFLTDEDPNSPKFSSTIAGASYAADLKVMQIIFKDKNLPEGRLYSYENVPQDVWDMFKGAESYGKFFHAIIVGPDRNKPNYPGVKV